MLILAAVVWHYWLSFAITALVLVSIIALGVGYFRKVTSMRPPRQ